MLGITQNSADTIDWIIHRSSADLEQAVFKFPLYSQKYLLLHSESLGFCVVGIYIRLIRHRSTPGTRKKNPATVCVQSLPHLSHRSDFLPWKDFWMFGLIFIFGIFFCWCGFLDNQNAEVLYFNIILILHFRVSQFDLYILVAINLVLVIFNLQSI